MIGKARRGLRLGAGATAAASGALLLFNQTPAAAFDRSSGPPEAAVALLPPIGPPAVSAPEKPDSQPSFELTLPWPEDGRLDRLLAEAGVARDQARAAQALVREHSLEGIPAGADIKLTLAVEAGSRRRLLGLTILSDHGDLRFIADGPELRPTAVADALRRHELRLDGRAYWSLRTLGVTGPAAQALLEKAGRLPEGATLSVVVGERSERFGGRRTKVLLYAAAGEGGRRSEWFRALGSEGEWVQVSGSSGRSPDELMQPTDGRVSSHFGMRNHPILGFLRFHRGIDYAAGWGTPVRAAADGEIAAAEWRGGYGRQVRIAHTGALSTSYSHLAEMRVEPGQQVRRGQLIGFVGASGLATGPHLHFEVFQNGRAIDPTRSATVRHWSDSEGNSALLERYRRVARG